MSVTDAVRKTADWFVRSKDAEVHRAITGVIQMIDPSGQITARRGDKWAVDMEKRVLIYKRTFGGRPLKEREYMYLTFHEGGHLLYTQSCPIPDWVTKPKAFHKLWNACEDMRMERCVARDFPGFSAIRNVVGTGFVTEAAHSRMADIITKGGPHEIATATWLSAMQNEYMERWSGNPRRPPVPDPYHFDYHLTVTACQDTHPMYRKAAESPSMQSMMPHVEDIYRYLFPDEDTEGEDGDDPDEPDEGEGEGEGEGGDPTEGDDEQDGDDTEGDESEDGESEGEGGEPEQDEDGDTEGEGGAEGDDDESEDTEGEQDGTEGDEDGESDTDEGEGESEGGGGDTEGEDDGEEGEGEKDDDSTAEGEGSGTDTSEGEPEQDEQDAPEQDGDDPTEGDESEDLEPDNLWDTDENFDEPPAPDTEPIAPGAWREYVMAGSANRFSTIMRSMLRKNDSRGLRHNVASGNLDLKRYYRMDSPIYDFNVFTRRMDPDKPLYALIISVDTSGSMIAQMRGKLAWQGALEAAATLAEAWKQLRLPWTVFGWGSRINYVVNDGSPSWQLDVVTTRGTSGGGTEEHVAVATALDLAMHYGRMGFQPIWFHISDGDAQSTDQAGIDTFVDTFGKQHLYFIGLNVRNRMGGRFPNFVEISSSADLYTYMKTTIRRQVYNAVR